MHSLIYTCAYAHINTFLFIFDIRICMYMYIYIYIYIYIHTFIYTHAGFERAQVHTQRQRDPPRLETKQLIS